MKRKYRLRQNSDFQRVREFGQSYAGPVMVLALLRNESDHNRVGFVVSKRLGTAAKRNLIKRQMREAVRLRWAEIKPGYDLILIARKSAGQARFTAICQALDRLLSLADLLL